LYSKTQCCQALQTINNESTSLPAL
jgi:hypothetical protein